MKLKIEFGHNGSQRIFNWYRDVEDFPHLIKHNGKNWAWIMYDTDKTGHADYVLFYSEVPAYDLEYGIYAKTLDEILGGSLDNSCECGAIYTSFPNHHMFFCPKWSRQ